MKLKYNIVCILGITVSIYACTKKEDTISEPAIGKTGPNLPAQAYDYLSNPLLNFGGTGGSIVFNNNSITLGRVLFYDKALSFNNTISCGSCHFQDKGFADNVKFHKGIFGNTLKRNTISITGNGGALFWDGRANSMEDLVLRPIANHDEMVQDPKALVERLKLIPYYKDLFVKAYNSDVIDLAGIESALASFCKAILPSETRFDKGAATIVFDPFTSNLFIDSTTQFFNFSPTENKGLALFFGKARCGTCHHPQEGGSFYGDGSPNSFANIGLDLNYSDNGVGTILNNANQNGVFKIPNLKNVALTGPFMHDGRFNTLEEVVEHYNSGIKRNANLSPKLFQNALTFAEIDMVVDHEIAMPVKLGLRNDEKMALVAFLKTLTDEQLVKDIKFSNPF